MSDQSDSFGNYPSMPAPPPGQPMAAGPPPPPVDNAVKLMFARAAVSLLSLVALLGTRGSLKNQVRKANPSFDTSKLDSTVTVAITAGVIVGLIFIGLYVALALQVRKGKQWARIVTLVLAALAVLSGLLTFLQPEPVLSRLLGVVSLVLDIAVIVFLTRRQSADYFRAAPGR